MSAHSKSVRGPLQAIGKFALLLKWRVTKVPRATRGMHMVEEATRSPMTASAYVG